MKMEPIERSETSVSKTQTPGNYPKETVLHHFDRLSISRHRLLNLPETRRKMQRWQNVGPRLVSQAGKINTLYTVTKIYLITAQLLE
jgi:hypothetical protein